MFVSYITVNIFNLGKGCVGIQTVKGAISAISKMHEIQSINGFHPYPNPHGKLIKSYVRYLKSKEQKRLRTLRVDPGKLSL